MKKLHLLIIVLVIAFFSSCQKEAENILSKTKTKPAASGRAGEITVVCPKKIWQGALGDSIFYYLSQPFYGLPQSEPTFKVYQLPPNVKEKIYKTNRNLLIVKIQPTDTIEISIDKWAKNQIVITLSGNDTNSMLKIWNRNKAKILELLFNKEIDRYQQAFKIAKNKEAIAKVEQMFNISLIIPSEFKIYDEKENFLWIERNTVKSIQALFITTLPYDTSSLSIDQTILTWNKLLKKYVPGPKKGTYPAIEERYPIKAEVLDKENNTILYRGLWKTEGGYFLGGPTLILNKIDRQNNRIISIFALIYGGKQDKKLLVWQVEAILKSLKLK